MYVPAHHRARDQAQLVEFMRSHPFAAVVTHGASGLRSTHLPLLLEEDAGRLRILAHLARANPQWQDLASGDEALVIYSGPHAYVSPRHYERTESVPTWNYAAVHAYGVATILDAPDDKLRLMERLIAQYDPDYLPHFRGLRGEYVRGRLAAVVGFSLDITRIEGRFKLSQDRLPGERQRVMAALLGSGDGAAVEVAAMMRAREAAEVTGS